MNIFRWTTKKIFVILAFMIGFSFSLASYAQSFAIEVASLAKKNNEWYQANTPNLLKKSAYYPKDISSAQLADSSIPNATEINEINKYIDPTAINYMYEIFKDDEINRTLYKK